MHVLALIGARCGSSLTDKNIRPLAGHPLLAYSIRAAKKTIGIDRVIVSTDSKDYADIAKSYGAEVPFLQPAHTARADSGDYPFISHALTWIEQNEKRLPDLIVHLRPTTPLRYPRLLEAAILRLAAFVPDATALRSVHEMSESAYKCLEVADNHLLPMYPYSLDDANAPRQQFPKTYHANGYVDVLRPSFIRQHGKLHGENVCAFVTPAVTEVDSEEDFAILEYQVLKNPALVNNLFD